MIQIFKRRGDPARFEPPDLPLGESELARIWAADDDQTATQTKAKAVPSEPRRLTPEPSADVQVEEGPVEAVEEGPAEAVEEGPVEASKEVDLALEALTGRRRELEAEAVERVAAARREVEARGAAQVEQQLEAALAEQRQELEVEADRLAEQQQELEVEADRLAEQRQELEAKAEERVAQARREAEAQVAEARRQAEDSAAAEIARLNGELELMEAEHQETLAHQERLRAAVREAEESAATLIERRPAVGEVSLRSATSKNLEALGLSATQARRIIRYRDKKGVDSPDRLHEVPGLPEDLLADLRRRIRN
ncbi:MAG: helix-hairpin-helix domain-containing protein [Chloroflexota bacterium]|nr:helix-hairpin-helix domain-containing protein [Chloroflexota bacterium]